MTTSENVITYDLGMPWYHQSKVPRGVQPTSKIRPFLDLAHGLLRDVTYKYIDIFSIGSVGAAQQAM